MTERKVRVKRRPPKDICLCPALCGVHDLPAERTIKVRRRKRSLHPNEKKAIRSVTEAISLYGEAHPLIQECLTTMVRISRGDAGYRGRYIGTRMRAISRILDTLVGRPREAPAPPGSEDEAKSAIVSLVQGLREGS